LYGVARRTIANHVRGERRRTALAQRLIADFEALADQIPEPASSLLADDRVAAAFAELNESDRELLALVAWEELPREEIAVAIGVSRAVVRLRLHRARRRFDEALRRQPALQRSTGAGQVSEQRVTARPGLTEGAPR
jgi:RNA polymerase sigma-70 factor (ECF subfamily)